MLRLTFSTIKRHTLEHIQEFGKSGDSDVHFFTIGAGALIDAELSYLDRIGKDTKSVSKKKQWPCGNTNKNNGESFCHFGWYNEAEKGTGGYSVVTIQNYTATVKIISSTDQILYQTFLKSRKSIRKN